MPWLDDFLLRQERALVDLRRDLHAHPELGRLETRTTGVLVDRLTAAGLAPRVLANGTGVVCDVGSGSGPLVALRADIDALPVSDDKDVPYRSTTDGVCHACGHDVHTTVVLGAALALAELGEELPGRVRLLFQHAEELMPGGAIDAIADGVLDGVSSIFALHCHPGYQVGEVGVRAGAITAAADMLEVELTGLGGHTARPHATSDLVYAASRVVTDLPALLSRRVDPRQGMSVVFGSIQSGIAANVIPRVATLRGTVRVLGQEAWEQAPKVVDELVAATLAPLGADFRITYTRGVPPVCNEEGATAVMTRAVTRAIGPDAVQPTEQSLGGEDFAWYLQHVPGSMARLGVRPLQNAADLHAGGFDVDERCIGVGVRVMAETALEALRTYA